VVGCLLLIPALVILVTAGAEALSPNFGGAALAGLIVGLILLGIAVILVFVAKFLLNKRPGLISKS
jgi:hypothetical protein